MRISISAGGYIVSTIPARMDVREADSLYDGAPDVWRKAIRRRACIIDACV
jgi:hypothetical protein